MLVAITGGARSGKSRAAVSAAKSLGAEVVFIATAEAGDTEMADRIARHQADRPAAWTTIEAPVQLAATVERVDAEATIVIDCLSMWVTNLMLSPRAAVEPEGCVGTECSEETHAAQADGQAEAILAAASHLAACLQRRNGTSIVVTNEVGSGVVPATPLGRFYRDVLGSVNQIIVRASDRAYLVVASRLLRLAEPDLGAETWRLRDVSERL